MPLQATSGAASYDGFGGGVAAVPNYIEDVFSTYLYTGNDSTQTITNGIDLSTNGGLVWQKSRNTTAGYQHVLYDTVRGSTSALFSSLSNGAVTSGGTYTTTFNTTGFTTNTSGSNINQSGFNQVSWTFRKQPKFFDVQTWTGNDAASRQIAHNLGSTPGCVIVKATNNTLDWFVSHRSLATANAYLNLNTTSASATGSNWGNSGGTRPTSTDFTVGDNTNISGYTYVAYLFAHDAGGFGLSGNENVISCGSYTGVTYPNSLEVNLGFEPQWVLIKNATTAAGWAMWDVMRGMSVVPAANTAQALLIEPNTTAADSNQPGIYPTPTGFVVKNGLTSISGTGDTITYIAIRRGPMKVPTSGTSVYNAITYNGVNTAGQVISGAGFSPDLAITKSRNGTFPPTWMDRLRGGTAYLFSDSTAAEGNTAGYYIRSFDMDGVTYGTAYGDYTNNAYTYVAQFLKRAPSFFDEVCYTGTGSATTFAHNLGAVPELMIVKNRTNPSNWRVYDAFNGPTKRGSLNDSQPWDVQNTMWNDTAPTSTVFTVGTSNNASGSNYVNYLFASAPGVSKVGSYTGTGTTLQINCGFTAGSRLVLIKRTDSTGDWYVWDSARGIVSGNDPYLLLNSTAAEVTNTDYIDTYSAGFEISSTAPADINASGGTFVFLAIA